ncbi:hypothetical protein Tco_1139508 [Tanacetum coccineum]
MDDPNITMEVYIRFEEEKAQKHGKVFNWETAKYGKIWYDEDIPDLRSVETKFPAIAFNNEVSSEKHFLVNPRCFDDLDFFKDFENEFPATVYNNAHMSKSDLLTESILGPQHIDEFDLNGETSLFEYDEEEKNVLYFNDLFPFNIIHTGDLKSEKDNDGNEIDIVQSSGDMALPPHDQRHQYLRYEGLYYTDADIVDFEARLAKIYMREVHRVQVFDIGGLPDLMVDGLSARMLMEHRDAQGANSAKQIPNKGDLRDYWIRISFAGDFLGIAPSYTAIRDPILRLCHRLIACSIARRSHASEKVTVTDLFYLGGMDVGSVNIFMDIDDTWAWVAMGPERQLDAAVGALRVAQDAPAIDEGVQADPTLV